MHGFQLVACRGRAWQHRPAPAAPLPPACWGRTTPAGSPAIPRAGRAVRCYPASPV